MEINQIRYFLAVADQKQFSKAAERLYVSQPNLSTQIKKLEIELGTRLFDRDTHSVSLTEAGREFQKYAKDIVASWAKLDASMKRFSMQHQKLVVGKPPDCHFFDIAGCIAMFQSIYPDIQIHLVEDFSSKLVQSFRQGHVEAMYYFSDLLTDDYLSSLAHHFVLGRDLLHAVVSRDNPLAQAEALSIEDLANSSIVLLSEATNMTRQVVHRFRERGLEPNLRYLSRSIDTLLSYVAKSNCVTFCSSQVVHRSGQQSHIRAIPLRPPMHIHLSFALSPHAEPTSLPMLFGSFVRDYGADGSDMVIQPINAC